MALNPLNTPVSFHQAASVALIALACRINHTPAQRKANLTELYQAGIISGETLAYMLRSYGLEAA